MRVVSMVAICLYKNICVDVKTIPYDKANQYDNMRIYTQVGSMIYN